MPFQIATILVLISAGCALPATQDAAAQAVAVEQQPTVPAGEPAPVQTPDVLPEPDTAPTSTAITDAPKPAAVPQPAKAKPSAAKPPVTPAPQATQPPATKVPTSATAAVQPAPPLALATLEQRLKDTSAIGVFTKLALKNQVDDLMSQFRARHEGSSKTPLAQLRQTYDQLLAKVYDLLKDGDPALATAIMNSRESIWLVLADPVRFAKL